MRGSLCESDFNYRIIKFREYSKHQKNLETIKNRKNIFFDDTKKRGKSIENKSPSKIANYFVDRDNKILSDKLIRIKNGLAIIKVITLFQSSRVTILT